MLLELKEKFKGKYPMECVLELEQMEKELLHYKQFTSAEALLLGCGIVDQAKKYKEDVAICIWRLDDDCVIFQYVGNGKSQRNIEFAIAKRNTSLKTGHCSLWAMAQEETYGGVDTVFCEDSGCLPAGGAFPIYVEGIMVACVSISGLHNGMDHQVVVEALCALQGKKIPQFSGLLV